MSSPLEREQTTLASLLLLYFPKTFEVLGWYDLNAVPLHIAVQQFHASIA